MEQKIRRGNGKNDIGEKQVQERRLRRMQTAEEDR